MGATLSLLSRDVFRDRVFIRDHHKCVFCSEPAIDAHHILERRLWSDGGYYLENGASVCAKHHLDCEHTVITVEDVRRACGITKPVIPDHLYDDQPYDKWGNPILANGTRLRGELFNDESVRKALSAGNALSLFSKYVKYPRTYHLPWSSSIGKDDRVIPDVSKFFGKRVVVSIKMDGENTTCYNDYLHARSLDSPNHPSRNWVKNYWSRFSPDIPEMFRICGENLFAKHSIYYDSLPTFFLGFSVWDQLTCLSWDDTLDWFELLDITPVTVMYDDIFDERKIKALFAKYDWNNCEGYVIRSAESFPYSNFRHNVAKFVRPDHIRTIKHWMHGGAITQNRVAKHID